MSKSIDERIVQMEFENGSFEKDAKTTMSTIDKLKDKLNFDDLSDGFKRFSDSASNAVKDIKGSLSSIDFSGIGSGLSHLTDGLKGIGGKAFDFGKAGFTTLISSIDPNNVASDSAFGDLYGNVESLANRFSTLGLIGQEAIRRITDSVIDLGNKIAHTLVLDQIQTGFSKYEKSIIDTIAIMNQAEESEERVDSFVKTLSWYSDATSFDINSMTSALKSFAQQGIALEDAIPVIMGIGNSVTYAGVGAKEGSAAFDLYSKAISQGYMDNRIWQSLSKSLGVATLGLKKQFLEAAIAAGTLKVNGDGTMETLDGLQVTVESFQQTLSDQKGKWLTSDVLMSVFGGQYGGFTERLSGFSQELKNATGEVLSLDEAIEKLGEADEKTLLEYGAQSVVDAREALVSTYGEAYYDRLLGKAEEYEKQNKGVLTVKDAMEALAGATADVGEKYLLSATQARTFTEAVDATKDAASTVWKDIFTDIFGTTSEAIETWTAFQDPLLEVFVEPLAALRDLTSGWKALGGRTMMLEGIARAWNNVKLAVEPIGEAFRNIFPKATADDLLRFTALFTNLQFQIKSWLNHEFNTEGFRKTLEGLFATVDILREGFKSLFSVAKPIGGIFAVLINEVLDLTAAFSDNIIKLRDYIKEHNGLDDALAKITGGLVSFKEGLKAAFEGRSIESTKIFSKAISAIGKAVDWLKKVTAPVFDTLSKGISETAKVLYDVVHNASFQQLFDLIKTLAFTKIGVNLMTFFRRLKDGFGLWDGLYDGIVYDLQVLGNYLKAMEVNIKAESLWNIAKAVALLSVSVLMLSSIPAGKLATSIGAIIVLIYGLTKALEHISAIQKNFIGNTKGGIFGRLFNSAFGSAGTIVALGASMLLLASSVKVLSTIDWSEMTQGLIGLAGVMTELLVFLKYADFSGLSAKAGLGLIGLAVGIRLLVTSIKAIGKMPIEQLQQGLGGLTILLIELGVALAIIPKEHMLAIGAGLLLASVGIGAIALALKLLGTMSMEKVGVGLVAIGGSLLILAAGVNGMKTAVPGALAMMITAIAIDLLAPALIALSLANPKGLAIALGALAVAIGVFTAAAAIIKTAGLAPSMLALSGSMLLLGASVGLLAGAFLLLSTVEDPGPALVAIAGSILIFAVAATALQGAVVPMLIFAGVVAAIGVAIALLGGGLFVVAAGVSAIAAAASLAAPMNVVLLALAGAVALVGVAAVIGAAGVLALGASFVILAKGALLVAPAVPVILGLAGAITLLAVAILGTLAAILYLTGHLTFADDLAEEGEKTKTSFEEIWKSIEIFFLNGLKNLLKDIPFIGGKIASSLDERIKEIENGELSSERSSKATQSYIDGITGTWDLSEEDLKAAGFDGSFAVVEGVNENEGEFSKSGTNFLQEFLNGLKNKNWLSQIGSQARAIGNLAKNNVNMSLGIQSPSEEMEWSGEMTDAGFVEGMENGLPGIEEAVGKLSDAVLEGMDFQKSAYELGHDSGADYGDGWNEGLAQSLEQIAPDHVLSKSQLEALDFALPENYTYDFGDEFDTNPTVTPVLDLSEIQNGAGDISTILNGQSVQANIDGIDSRNSQFQDTVLYDLQSMRNDIQILAEGQRDLQARDRRLIQGIQDAFEEVGVYIDGDRIGRFVERYQNNVRRAAGV